MRHLAMALALACVFSGVTRAGEIHSTGAIAAPGETPGTGMATGGEIPPANGMGENHNTGATASDASDALLATILTLIDIVP